MQPQRFTTTLASGSRDRAFVAVPFDPDQVWRPKPQHHIAGTVNGMGIRAVIEVRGDQRGFTLGPAWLRDCRTAAIGDLVTVEIVPEGPQRVRIARRGGGFAREASRLADCTERHGSRPVALGSES